MNRNHTELTHNITRNVALWMDGKGFKPVETEVGVGPQWVADVAGVGLPTQTEMIDLNLIKRPPQLRGWKHSDYERERHNDAYAAWRLAYERIPQRLIALVEVKTSVGDYRGDRKWTAIWPTHLCYIAIPEGMIPEAEWPFNWGVILFSQEGTTIRKVHPPKWIAPINVEQQLDVILNIAVARDHHTRYARLREQSQHIRINEGERTTISRVQNAIGVVLDVMKGKTVEEACLYHGIRAKLPEWTVKRLEELRPKP